MILPDVNVLIYAFRRDSPYHKVSRAWLENLVNGETRFGLSPLALSALVRIVSNRKAFAEPNTVAEAFEFCDALLDAPRCQIVEPKERHWHFFRRLCLETGTIGPTVTDAWYAALAIEWGCRWITFDRDYARFPGLDWREPAV
jgi:toxin-antitoxin system PIN domain toxin